jgi:hypothetical protein
MKKAGMIEIVRFVAFVIFCSNVIVFSQRARIRQKLNQEMGYAYRSFGGVDTDQRRLMWAVRINNPTTLPRSPRGSARTAPWDRWKLPQHLLPGPEN